MGSAFDDLSSVIFRQSIELSLKFLKLRGWLGRVSKHFGLCWQQALQDWTGNLLRYLELDSVWILVFVNVLLNSLKPPEMIIMSV